MSKKKEFIKVIEPVNLYPIEDADKMRAIFKWYGGFTNQQQDDIVRFLRKYVDPGHPVPISGCNCPSGWGPALVKLRDWFGQNGNKFS